MTARLQVHGDRGSVIIDSDVLSVIYRTPTEANAAERAYGKSDDAINQVDEFPEASGTRLSAGARPSTSCPPSGSPPSRPTYPRG